MFTSIVILCSAMASRWRVQTTRMSCSWSDRVSTLSTLLSSQCLRKKLVGWSLREEEVCLPWTTMRDAQSQSLSPTPISKRMMQGRSMWSIISTWRLDRCLRGGTASLMLSTRMWVHRAQWFVCALTAVAFSVHLPSKVCILEEIA